MAWVDDEDASDEELVKRVRNFINVYVDSLERAHRVAGLCMKEGVEAKYIRVKKGYLITIA